MTTNAAIEHEQLVHQIRRLAMALAGGDSRPPLGLRDAELPAVRLTPQLANSPALGLRPSWVASCEGYCIGGESPGDALAKLRDVLVTACRTRADKLRAAADGAGGARAHDRVPQPSREVPLVLAYLDPDTDFLFVRGVGVEIVNDQGIAGCLNTQGADLAEMIVRHKR